MPRKILAVMFPALVLALSVAIVAPSTSARADVIAPGVPGPVDILPSVGIAATKAGASAYERAYLIVQYAMNNGLLPAEKAVAAGTATLTEAGMVAAAAAKFAAPAVKAVGLLKTAGGVGVTIAVGWSIGTSIGAGVSRIAGFKDDDVCSEDDVTGLLRPAAGFLDGVDCAAYDGMIADAAQRNLDASAGVTADWVCSDGGTDHGGSVPCFKAFTGVVSSTGGAYDYYCFVGVDGGGYNSVWFRQGGTNLSTTSLGWPTSGYSGDCAGVPAGMERVVFSALTSSGSLDSYGFGAGPGSGPQTAITTGTADPDRFWRCEITANTGSVYTLDSATFKESDPSYAPIQCPPVGAGEWGTHQTIYEMGGPDPLEVSDSDTTPEYQAAAADYPECLTGACVLSLAPTATPTVSCFSVPAPCADWFASPTKADDFECTYGTHAVDLAECNLYSPTFKPDAGVDGHGYADPLTGDELTAQTSPSSDQDAFGSDVQDPAAARQCFPTGWAVLNPVEWVMKPVQCALQWAFVPRASALESVNEDVQARWTASAPGAMISAVVAAISLDAPETGCEGMAVDMSWVPDAGLGTFYFLPACPGDFFEVWAGMFKVFLYGSVGLGGAIGITRNIAAIFGYRGVGGE